MGKLVLHTGSKGSYYFFKDKILEDLATNNEPFFLYLLPVNRAVRYLKKQLVTGLEHKAILDPPVFTFRSFIKNLYDHFPEKKKIISPQMRLLLLQHILNTHDKHLDYFPDQGIIGNGLVLKAERMVEEFFQFGFRPEDFEKPPSTADKKFSDFSFLINEIFNLYQDKLTDESSLMAEVLKIIDSAMLL